MSQTRTLKVSFGKPGKKNLSVVKNEELTWQELVSRFEEPVRDDVTLADYLDMSVEEQSNLKNKGYFVGGQFKDGKRRKVNLECRSVVTLDIDDHADTVWDEIIYRGGIEGLKGLAYHVHTTRKHTIEKPRFRVIVPLAADVTKDEYELVVRYVAELVDENMMAVAAESFVTAQLMFMPSVCSDGEFFHQTFDGKFLDPKKAFKKYDITDPDSWPVRPDGVDSAKGITGSRQHPEDKKTTAPIITAVHRAYTPEDFIEQFLSDHYEYVGEGRYRPFGASGAASVRIYDDAFIHSDHSHSDVAHGQHTTFDTGRLVLFGDLDDGIDKDDISSPVELESYKAMEALMRQQPAVLEALAEIEAEIEEEQTELAAALLPDFGDDEEDDDEDDLIGDTTPKRKKPKTLEEYCTEVFRLIRIAENVDDLQKVCHAIAGAPADFLQAWRRENFIPKIIEKAKELGSPMTKAFVRKEVTERKVNRLIGNGDDNRPEWLDDVVFVVSENAFYCLSDNEMRPMGKEAFNNRYFKEAIDTYGVTENGTPRIPALSAALGSNNPVPRAIRTTYDPQHPDDRLPIVGGECLLNLYRPAIIERTAYRGNEGVKLYKRLMKDLFPDDRERALVSDFVAHCVKFPGVKLPYALLVKGSRNEGKSTLKTLITRMLGKQNCNEINNDVLKEKHNGWISNRCFVGLEEVKIGGLEAYAVLEKMKPLISNSTASVRAMNKDAEQQENLANFYMMTNHENALPLDESDDRYLVVFTRFHTDDAVTEWREANREKEGVHYVQTLYEHIKDHPWQFKAYFEKYQFSEYYRPKERAPRTRYRTIVANNARSEAETILQDLLDDDRYPCITSDILIMSHLKEAFQIHGVDRSLNTKSGASFLVPQGFRAAQNTVVRIDGNLTKLSVYTRDVSLLQEDGKLSLRGKEMLKKALEKHRALEEGEGDDMENDDLI